MCVTLKAGDGSKLSEKCTTDKHGGPFLIGAMNEIVVTFDSIKNVKSVRITFNSGKPGQIAEFKVYGFYVDGLKL